LYEQGKGEAAIKVEHFWDEIAKAFDVDILCGCVWASNQCQANADAQIERIRAERSTVPSEFAFEANQGFWESRDGWLILSIQS
jgi:hypothetical protein